jgi:hypothetical protein
MNRRIQRALDGELPVHRLSEPERHELAAYRAAIEAALETVDTAVEPAVSPDVSATVMWRIRGLEPEATTTRVGGGADRFRRVAGEAWSGVRAAAGWLLAPQPLRLRPAAVFGAMALVAVALAVSGPDRNGPAGEGELPRLLVQFRISTEGARQVALVGDFSGWEGRPLEEVAPGVWTTTIPLEPGLYDYAFIIDGERWQLDPLAPAVADGFGGANSRIAVLAPEGRSF